MRFSCAVMVRMLAWLCVTTVALGGPPSRLHQRIETGETVTLPGNIRPLSSAAADEGEADSALALSHMSIHFRMTTAQQADLDQLLKNLQDRSSSSYHKWLTPQQYADRFGISASDMKRVVEWLQSAGFTNIEPAAGRTSVSMSGNAAQVRSAFQISLHRYQVKGEQHYANSSDPVLPKALDGMVASIRGLNDFRPHPHRSAIRPRFTSNISGNHYITPDDFATIYDLHTLYNGGIDGSGVSIAVAGQTDIALTDIAAFRSAAGLAAKAPEVQLVGIDPGTSKNDVGEASLDVEWSGGVARNATVIYVNSANAFDSAQYAIDHNLAAILSISYGECEAAAASDTTTTTFEPLFKEANAQGMTIVAAGGDNGAADCDSPATPSAPAVTQATQGLAVDYPASSQYVTAIGGTEFTDANTTGATQYWGGTNNSGNGSALSYIPEQVWNDTATQGSLSAGGGGASTQFIKPAWQQGSGVPSDGARDVPDVALTASPAVDPVLICDSGWCTNGFRNASSYLDASGGTSVGAPAFAGIVALINQKAGGRQGNINPTLYQLAGAAPDAFHDVTLGNNIVPCKVGTPNCPTAAPGATTGEIGYVAGPGYDEATGLGSVDGTNLVNQWPDFQITLNPTSVTIAAGTSANVTVKVTRTALFTGSVTFTCAVPSTLTGVTCAAPTSISNSGSATMTLTRAASADISPMPHWNGFTPTYAAALLLLLGATVAVFRRRREVEWGGAFFAMLALAGCGGGSSAASVAQTVAPTPVTANVTVTATSGALQQTSTIAVTLQ